MPTTSSSPKRAEGPLQSLVRQFHDRHGFHRDKELTSLFSNSLIQASRELEARSNELRVLIRSTDPRADGPDPRLCRAQLMIEELGEVVHAMTAGDETALADGLADLMYVTLGTGVAFGLPVEALLVEVHRSNMTKDADVRQHKPLKGASFSPPDVKGTLDRAEAAVKAGASR